MPHTRPVHQIELIQRRERRPAPPQIAISRARVPKLVHDIGDRTLCAHTALLLARQPLTVDALAALVRSARAFHGLHRHRLTEVISDIATDLQRAGKITVRGVNGSRVLARATATSIRRAPRETYRGGYVSPW